MAHNVERTIKNMYAKMRSVVKSFTKKNNKEITSRLDALLIEKAREEGIELQLKSNKKKSFLPALIFGLTGVSAVLSISLIIAFVPGPWTRFFAKPTVETFSLNGVEYSENGVVASKQALTLSSPKPIRGTQYVTNNLVVEPAVDYSVTLSENKKDIIIQPTEELENGVTYTVSLKPGVLFDDSTYLVNEQSWVIPTKAKFDLVSISPKDGAQAATNSTIQIEFSTDEFELSDAIEHINIYPKVKGEFSKVSSRIVFAPSKKLLQGGTYTVTVSKELANIKGQTLSDNFKSTFNVLNEDVDWSKLPFLNTQQVYYNHSEGFRAIYFYGYNINSVTAQIYKVEWVDIKPYIDQSLTTGTGFNMDDALTEVAPIRTIKLTPTRTYSNSAQFKISLNKEGNGIYVVKLSDTNHPAVSEYVASFISNFGVYASRRSGAENIDVWAFDYPETALNAGVKLTSVSCQQEECNSIEVETPDNGHQLIESKTRVSYIFAQKGNSAVLVQPNGFRNSFNQDLFSKIIVNKPVYIPGDELSFSVLLREYGDNGSYVYPHSGETFKVKLCKYSGWGYSTDTSSCITEKDIPVNEYGVVEGSFGLWDRAEDLSLYIFRINGEEEEYVDSRRIEIYNVDKPQVQMSLKMDKNRYIGEDSAKISGRLTNYVDIGIPNKKIKLELNVQGIYNDEFEVSVETDSSGNFTYEYVLPFNLASNYEYTVGVYASTHDGDNVIYKYASAAWDSDERIDYIVTVDGYETSSVGENEVAELSLEAINITTGDKIDKAVQLVISRSYSVEILGVPYYDDTLQKMVTPTSYTSRTETVLAQDINLSAGNPYTVELEDLKYGSYYMRIVDNRDYSWRVSDSYDLFYVSGRDEQSLNSINEWVYSASLDKNSYNVGDKAKLNIRDTFDITSPEIILIERSADSFNWRKISISTSELEIPITKEMAGGITVCVVHPQRTYAFENQEQARNAVFTGYAINNRCDSAIVENTSKKLDVKVEPTSKTVLPGTESNIEIQVLNSDGEGEQANVGVTVVDKALYDAYYSEADYQDYILDLYKDIYKTFTSSIDYGTVSVNVYDAIYRGDLGGRGAGGNENASLRSDFNDNPLWIANLETDAEGKITVSVPYSDSITSWVVLVWAATEDLQVGTNNLEIQAKKDVFVDIDVPQVVRVGDKWVPYVRVVNTMGKMFTGTLSISCDGCLDASITKTISLSPDGVKDIKIVSNVTESGDLPFTATLKSNGDVVDSMEIKIKSKPLGSSLPMTERYVASKGNEVHTFTIPEDAKLSFTDFSLTVSNDPFVSNNTEINTEVATTRELSGAIMAIAQKLQKKQSIVENNEKEQLNTYLSIYVLELKGRILANGGVPFNASGDVNNRSTLDAAYAYSFLKNSELTSHYVDTSEFSLLRDYLKGMITSDTVVLEKKAEAAYVLSRIDPDDAVRLIMALYKISVDDESIELSTETKGFLSLALVNIGANSDATALVIDMLDHDVVKTGENGLFVPSPSQNILTIGLAFSMHKLGLVGDSYDVDLKSLQDWIIVYCGSCGSALEQIMVSDLYVTSLSIEDTVGSKPEVLAVYVNGELIQKIPYNGIMDTVDIPGNSFNLGKNSMSVISESGSPLFVTLSGDVFSDISDDSTKINDDLTINVSISGIDSNRSTKVGNSGYYILEIEAKKDLPSGEIQIALPTGCRYSPKWISKYEDFKEKVTYAYGDQLRSDVLTAYVRALNKGEKHYVLVPFISVRQGNFNGATVLYTNPLYANPTVVIDKRVNIN